MLLEVTIAALLLGDHTPPQQVYTVCTKSLTTGCLPWCDHAAGPCLERPKPSHIEDPEYPEQARRDRVQGVVVLSIELDETGKTRNVKVVRSLREDIDERAVEAVRRWRFKPAQLNGKPVPIQMNVEVSMHLYR